MTDREKRQWEKERAKGLGRYLVRRGLLLYGLVFAVLMTVSQIFIFHESATAEKRLFNFLIYVVAFGGFMGVVTWRLNENDYQKPSEGGDGD